MGQYNTSPTLVDAFKDIKARIRALANAQAIPVYTVASRPATSAGLTIIFVQDATAGSRYQGWDSAGGAWVPLG